MTHADTIDPHGAEPPVAAIDSKSVRTLPAMFDLACTRYARRPAFSSFNHTIEYRDVAQYARRFSGFLITEFRLEPSERVALILPNGLPYVVAFFGVLDAGLIVANVNPLATPREIQIQLSTAAVSAIVVLENFAWKLDDILDENQAKAVVSVAVGDLLPLRKRAAIDFVQRVVRDSIRPTKRRYLSRRGDGLDPGRRTASAGRFDTRNLRHRRSVRDAGHRPHQPRLQHDGDRDPRDDAVRRNRLCSSTRTQMGCAAGRSDRRNPAVRHGRVHFLRHLRRERHDDR
ncbi:AMP-binding protein [Paraburkholderia terrae]|uniref:AMP-binding protein n=1 Tax=Paraburkholderia terrae TaxID=311230 RepID=UPI003A5C1329